MIIFANKKKCLHRHIFIRDDGSLLFLHLPTKRARRKFIKNYYKGATI